MMLAVKRQQLETREVGQREATGWERPRHGAPQELREGDVLAPRLLLGLAIGMLLERDLSANQSVIIVLRHDNTVKPTSRSHRRRRRTPQNGMSSSSAAAGAPTGGSS